MPELPDPEALPTEEAPQRFGAYDPTLFAPHSSGNRAASAKYPTMVHRDYPELLFFDHGAGIYYVCHNTQDGPLRGGGADGRSGGHDHSDTPLGALVLWLRRNPGTVMADSSG